MESWKVKMWFASSIISGVTAVIATAAENGASVLFVILAIATSHVSGYTLGFTSPVKDEEEAKR